jgi:hypothetical protein
MKKNTNIIQMNKLRLLDKKPRDLLLLAAQLGAIFWISFVFEMHRLSDSQLLSFNMEIELRL